MARTSSKKAKPQTKQEAALGLLRRKNGTSLEHIMKITGWQAHSVRGFLSDTVKEKLELKLTSKQIDPAFENTMREARHELRSTRENPRRVESSCIKEPRGAKDDISKQIRLTFLASDIIQPLLDGADLISLIADHLRRLSEVPTC